MMIGVGTQPRPIALPVAVVTDRDEVLGRVFREEYGSLVGIARLLLDEPEDAEEAVQEAFTRVYDRWSRVRRRNDPLPYIRRVVVNIARDGLRRRRTADRCRSATAPHVASAEAIAILDESRREVLDAVRGLRGRQRESVVLRYYLDCSTAETAAILGVSEGSVKTHLHRALAAMAKQLEDPA